MKFAETLSAHITPEWRKQYIQYEEMKAMVYAAIEEAPAAEAADGEELQRYFASFDEKFFTFCDKELTKIDTFYSEKLAEATRKLASLKGELVSLTEPQSQDKKFFGLRRRRASSSTREKPATTVKKLKDLKLAFSEYYLSLVLLQSYQNLNFTGFRKILKKHDKNLSNDAGAKWRVEKVETAHFYTNKSIEKLIQETEGLVTSDLEGGDRQKAMKRLRVPPLGESQSPWITFKVGLFSGAFVVLAFVIALSAIFQSFPNPEGRGDWRVAVRLYRGPFLVILFIFLMGINVHFWRVSGVNHVLIFELDPRKNLAAQDLMELAAVLGVIWALSILGFLYSESFAMPAYASPLALVVTMFVFLLNPTKTFRYESRRWLLWYLFRIFVAPFPYVGFADFWLADQLNSMATVFLDAHYTICFYTAANTTVNGDWMVANEAEICADGFKRPWDYFRPYFQMAPALFRFLQCLRRYQSSREAFPHLVNAGKYSTTFFVVIFSTLKGEYPGDVFFYLWLISAVANSIYAYAWDIKMDWGLLDGGENPVLRDEMVYSSRGYYYFAIAEDALLRLSWAADMLLKAWFDLPKDILTTFLAPLEVFRRFVWNFFRLENEHLNNCGKFRAVRDIYVTPIEASDQSQIIKMMDEEDGVMQVRMRKAAAAGKRTVAVTSPIETLKAIAE